MRISDADREGVVEQLRRHCGDGRLTLDEFAERAGDVYAARTRAELRAVLADLPNVAASPAVTVSEPPTSKKRKWVVAIMSAARRRGRWRVDRPMTAFAFWGNVCIDLRGAQIDVPVVDIRAWAIMAGVDVIVPEGIPVELDGFVLMGGRDDRVRDVPPVPGAPLVRVHAYGMWGGVTVRSRSEKSRDPGERLAEEIQRRVERSVDRAARHAARAARHAPPPPPAPPPAGEASAAMRSGVPRQGALPPTSTDGLIPPLPRLPDHVQALLRSTGLIDAVAAGDGNTVGEPAADVPRGTVTILFTDIAGSTELAEQLGDQRWMGVLQAHNALVREQIQRHSGTEVKCHGDGFMVVFPSARSALLCAIGIQRAIAGYRAGHPDTAVAVRIGLHTGEVVEEKGDYFGRNVILAARIADTAKGGEILASALVKELTDSSGDLGFDGGVDVELKGMSRPWRVHRVEWN